jgi:glycerol-3-phosphate cytidylyltransferase-like family protein
MNMGTWEAISLEDMMVVVVSTNDHSISIMKEKPYTEKRKRVHR